MTSLLYSPLPTERFIRLLTIHPGDGPIQCSLQVVSINEAPSYDALSYTWGDPRPPILHSLASEYTGTPHTIQINGAHKNVGANLFNGLQVLRSCHATLKKRKLSAHVWIDALCINQEDDAEKNKQVSIMDEIYEHAQLVVYWLGATDAYTDPAVELISYLAGIPENEYPEKGSMKLDHYHYSQDYWRALVAFFRRAWFSRVWTIQEVALARDRIVLCGAHEIEWETLERCTRYLNATGLQGHLNIFSAEFASRRDREIQRLTSVGLSSAHAIGILTNDAAGGSSHNSNYILQFGRIFDATNPKDHVYGLLGLLKRMHLTVTLQNNFESFPLEPDYSKTVAQVYTDATIFMLHGSGNLAPLSFVGDMSMRRVDVCGESMPSWVPDLGALMHPVPLLLTASHLKWNPAGISVDEGSFQATEQVLYVNGARLDRIVACATPFDDVSTTYDWSNILELTRPLWYGGGSGTPFAEAFWKTLIANSEPSSDAIDSRIAIRDEEAMRRAFGQYMLDRLVLLSVAFLDPTTFNVHTTSQRVLSREFFNRNRASSPSGGSGSVGATLSSIGQFLSGQASLLRPLAAELGNRVSSALSTPERHARMRELLSELANVDRTGAFVHPQTRQHISREERDRLHALAGAFRSAFSRISWTRRMFRTSGNYLGIGSESLREGDEVWVLRGTIVPFVLRPVGDGQYQLIGEAYVHGIMADGALAGWNLTFVDIEMV